MECGHVFCERCVTKEFAATGKCKKCGKKINGIFNSGVKVLEKAALEREARQAAKKEKKQETGSAPSYLQGLTHNTARYFGNDTEEPVVVSQAEIEKALRRIKQQSKKLTED